MLRVVLWSANGLLAALFLLVSGPRPETVTFGQAAAVPSPQWSRDGWAFLEKHCIQCHGAKNPKADLTLTVLKDEAFVSLKGRKTVESVLRMIETGEMPPKNRPRPAIGELETFRKTVSAVWDKADRTTKPDPGRITVRRLNRTEYANTVRDLIGIDFNPAEDFPSDDIGHGFDNIGDVLTLSPVLMERYLAAAETITQRAILVGPPPKSPNRRLASMFLSPPPKGGFRETPFRSLTDKSELSTVHKLTTEGEYRLRIRAWGGQAGDEPIKVGFNVAGKDVGTVDIKVSKDRAGTFQSDLVKVPAGDTRVSFTFLNPYTKPKEGDKPEVKREFFVQWLEFEGPMDMVPVTHKRLMAPATSSKPPREQAREILIRFATRAYRRPATAGEIDRLLKLVDESLARKEPLEAGIRLAVQAVLVSPKFLFRLEQDDRPDLADAHPISEFHLASRLSYFLWSTMPDDELFGLAEKGQFSANLEKQVRRMLADPKARALTDNFAMQWLQLQRLATHSPDPKKFPGFDDRLRRSMLEETRLFLDAIIREDRSILEIIDADFTFLNERLARHYGIADTAGNKAYAKATRAGGKPFPRGEQFLRVNLAGTDRGGLLTQASVLTVTSNPTRTSPVKRGKWVLDQLLGTPPPPPPPDVPELENDKKMLTGTLRQRMEQHRANPSCAACHARMDPIGFAFENYDGVGQFRAKDEGQNIDTSGELPGGKKFNGPAELKAILKGRTDLFAKCLAEKMLTYALGRGLEHYDKRAVNKITVALPADGFKVSRLVLEIVKSEPFRLRRGKGQEQ